ncbi:conserved Plasmodium protein, unknown function [Plasmodium ovale]|uniref:Tetratricopeptide repeat protein n=1 Tax=Plasmodium ovale TaxID=36330 RepID=A0A1D3KXN2_PLAOA|nr:conserved Plasmodium protein, unknown function [Plasmodium ovale]
MFLSEDLDPEELKNEANIKWGKGEIEDANTLWSQALKQCIKYSMRGYPTKKNRDMQLSLRLNLSLYHLKKKEYVDCINQCNIILDNIVNVNDMFSYYENNIDSEEGTCEATETGEGKETDRDAEEDCATDSGRYIVKRDTLIKIFLRRATSFLCLHDFDKCGDNISLVRKLDPQNGEALTLERKMKLEEIDYERKQREMYRKMYQARTHTQSTEDEMNEITPKGETAGGPVGSEPCEVCEDREVHEVG